MPYKKTTINLKQGIILRVDEEIEKIIIRLKGPCLPSSMTRAFLFRKDAIL